MKTKLVVILVYDLCVFPMDVWAGFYRTGPAEGAECKSFFIAEKCTVRSVDAVMGDDDTLYSLAEYFDKVDEYRDSRTETTTGRPAAGRFLPAAHAFPPPRSVDAGAG